MAIATQRVLIVKTSSLGDIMHGLQVAQALKENDPGIEISWIARRRFESLVSASSPVDHTFTFYRSGGVSGFWKLCRQLRRQRFDVVLDMQGLARSGLMTFFSRADRKVGRTDAREGASLFYRELAPLPRGFDQTHPVDILLEFCRVFGFEPELKSSVRFEQKGEDWREAFSTTDKGPRVVIAPEGRRNSVNWPYFECLAKDALERFPNVRLRLVTQGSVPWAESLARHANDRFRHLRTHDWHRIASCIQNADLLIANDSDALQIAAATGIGTLGLFGPSDPNRVGAYPLSEPRNRALVAPGGELKNLKSSAVLSVLEDEIEKRY
jgi:heptosyltransferase-1